jgi:uncharacterized protein
VSSVSRPGDEPSPSESETKQIEATWKGLATDYLRSMVDGVSPDPILMGLYYADLMRIHRRRQTPMPPTLHPNGICDPGGRRLFCTVDGELQVCERVGEGFTLGDVERGVDAGAALRLAESYAASSTRSGCCDCPAVRLCTTCFTTAVVQRGEAHAQHKHCKAIRANLEHMMSVYCAIGEARPEALGAFENAGVRELSDLV